jgi:hypothetical protein
VRVEGNAGRWHRGAWGGQDGNIGDAKLLGVESRVLEAGVGREVMDGSRLVAAVGRRQGKWSLLAGLQMSGSRGARWRM